jgi:hypothetical protein
MYKSALAYIDASMGVFLASGVKKYEITWGRRLILNTPPSGAHELYGARQPDTSCFVIDINDQPAAIKATLWGIATIDIGNAYETYCRNRNIFCADCSVLLKLDNLAGVRF